jgi:glycosyltransferase involved in cell wall biosynthesis
MSQDRIRLVRHGLPLEQFEPVVPCGRLILAIGRLVEKKGFAYLIEACAALAGDGIAFECVIAGDGPEREDLAAAVDRLQLGERVTLKGAVSHDEALALYRQARIFALPCVVSPGGDRDGVPNTILEAMATGLPVVAGRAGGTAEAVEEGVTGFLVTPRDAEALAEKLRLLLEDGEMCQRLGRAGRTVIQRRFDIKANAAELKRQFEFLIP